MRAFLSVLFLGRLFAADALTAGFDNSRDYANTAETVLTQASIQTSKFQHLWDYPVTGAAWAQPLIRTANIGGASHVLFTCTMHDVCYLFNADRYQAAPIWSRTLGTPDTTGDEDFYGDPTPVEIGSVSTPVIDSSTNVAYVTALIVTQGWTLFALKLSDGTDFHAPVVIAGSANGQTFSSPNELQRTALLLSGGNVYIGFGSYHDGGTLPNGWLFAYSAATLSQVGIFCADSGALSAIWQSGRGPAADGSGNIYVATGNGPWNGTTAFGESLIKLSSTLSVLDYFTPANWSSVLNMNDSDLGAGGPLLFGSNVIQIGKDGNAWLFAQATLGGLQGAGAVIVQNFTTGHNFGGLAFANNQLFTAGLGFSIERFDFSGGMFGSATDSSFTPPFPGAEIAYSSNGATAGTDILWSATGAGSSAHAPTTLILKALRPSTMATIFTYNSAFTLAKFSAPVPVNGKVYVSTLSGVISVLGMPNFNSQQSGNMVSSGALIQQ